MKSYAGKISDESTNKHVCLGDVALHSNELATALECYTQAGKVKSAKYGKNHFDIKIIFLRKATVFYRVGDKKQANKCIREAEKFGTVDASLKLRIRKMKHAPVKRLSCEKSLSKCSNPHCVIIETTQGEFKRCSVCRIAKYCCRECQRAHWKSHKQFCKNIR
jgi:hypothetical protein